MMGRERRKWSAEEDRVLRGAVEDAERTSRPVEWQSVALKLPGRTNKDCRKRWCNSLADRGNEGIWSISEDERLREAVRRHGTKWARVASDVRTRNGDQCSKRWSHSVNPSLDRSPWTREEDQALLSYVNIHGNNWQTIVSTHLPHRSALSAKNRHFLLNRKSNSKSTHNNSTRNGEYHQHADYASSSIAPTHDNYASLHSPITTAQAMAYTTPTTRTVPLYIPSNHSDSTFFDHPTTSYAQPTYSTRTHVSPGALDLSNSYFPNDVFSTTATSPTLRRTVTTASSPQAISPQSYTGSSFSQSHFTPRLSQASSQNSMVSGSPMLQHHHAQSPRHQSYQSAYTSWPERHGSSSFESESEAMQRFLVEAECAPEQVAPFMHSVNAYSRSATFMPGSCQ